MCLKCFFLFFFCPESLDEAGDSTASSKVQVKEEEEETEEPPVAKRRRGQSKSQTKTEDMPKEEIKSEGNMFLFVVCCVGNTILKWNVIL